MKALATGAPAGPIEGARRSDLANIRWLLDVLGLPSEDVTESSLEDFLVFRDSIGVARIVGLERCGDAALLRSLAVADGHASRGLGTRLVRAAEVLAQDLHLQPIYRLTTTAELFFEHLGYRLLDRELAPAALKHSAQFKSLCPSTARLMVKP
jgi:amino-acid N-acetyltransferase